jgi:hypothetical protein
MNSRSAMAIQLERVSCAPHLGFTGLGRSMVGLQRWGASEVSVRITARLEHRKMASHVCMDTFAALACSSHLGTFTPTTRSTGSALLPR